MQEKEILKGKVDLLGLKLIISIILIVLLFIGMISDQGDLPLIVFVLGGVFMVSFWGIIVPQLLFGSCKSSNK